MNNLQRKKVFLLAAHARPRPAGWGEESGLIEKTSHTWKAV